MVVASILKTRIYSNAYDFVKENKLENQFKEKFGITDEEILQAIRIHSTLDKNPSTLQKIVFVADYMEYMRSKGEEKSYTRLRNIAITELDIVAFWIINFKILDIMR